MITAMEESEQHVPTFVVGIAHWFIRDKSIANILKENGYTLERLDGAYEADRIPQPICSSSGGSSDTMNDSTNSTDSTTEEVVPGGGSTADPTAVSDVVVDGNATTDGNTTLEVPGPDDGPAGVAASNNDSGSSTAAQGGTNYRIYSTGIMLVTSLVVAVTPFLVVF